MTFKKLLDIILKTEALDEFSFSGNCFSMAYTLNELLPESKIVISFNKRLWLEKKQYIGHCAIKYNNQILDGEGLISEEDFQSWGMLDEHDLSYIEGTSISKKEWIKDAYEAEIIEVSKNDITDYVDLDVVETVKELILVGVDAHYIRLAELLSDHLNMLNKLDIELLKEFPEFLYAGEAYRLLVLKNSKSKVKSLENQSFSKNLEGSKDFVENYMENDMASYKLGHKRLFKADIVGFDLEKAIKFLSDNKLGITLKTYNSWKDENEVISFEVKNIQEIDISIVESK